MELTAQTLASGGGVLIAAYAVIQFARLVTSVSGFLARLDGMWRAEEGHRTAEAAHWAAVLSALERIGPKARVRR